MHCLSVCAPIYFAGAGKTYTMLGTESDPGIMVLTLNSLFETIEDTSNDMIYRVTMAYMEVCHVTQCAVCYVCVCSAIAAILVGAY